MKGDRRWGTGDGKQGDRKQETGDGRQEMGETGNRETENRKWETGDAGSVSDPLSGFAKSGSRGLKKI